MDILYKISGRVFKGEQRGRGMGYPTANIALHTKIPEGIYAATVTLNNKAYYAATFVGSAKTFQRTEVNVESYIFNFDSVIYDKWITVKLYKKIRGNQIFDSMEDLVVQMDKDVQEIKTFFQLEQ